MFAESVRPSKLKRAERVGIAALGREDRDLSKRAKGAQVGLRVHAPLVDAELVVDRTRDREVALCWVVHSFGDTQLPHHLRNEEALIRVPLPVDVRRLVDRDVADLELDVLPMLRVEPAQEEAFPNRAAFGL